MSRKKVIGLAILMIVLQLFAALSVSAASLPYSETAAIPRYRYNNTLVTSEYITISSGEAVIYASYIGFQGVTEGATIDIKLQRKVFIFWVDVDNGQTDNTWSDSFTGYLGSVLHSIDLSVSGDYRAKITYNIYGSGGSADEISVVLYDSY